MGQLRVYPSFGRFGPKVNLWRWCIFLFLGRRNFIILFHLLFRSPQKLLMVEPTVRITAQAAKMLEHCWVVTLCDWFFFGWQTGFGKEAGCRWSLLIAQRCSDWDMNIYETWRDIGVSDCFWSDRTKRVCNPIPQLTKIKNPLHKHFQIARKTIFFSLFIPQENHQVKDSKASRYYSLQSGSR